MTLETLREAVVADLGAINDIYNAHVEGSDCTLQLEPSTSEERQAWFEARRREGLPVLVLERGAEVLGWGALMRYSERMGYRFTAEDSVYLRPGMEGAGRGRRILEALLERAEENGLHRVLAKITATQSASLALHRRCGFEEQGRLSEVGHKFGRWVDVVFLVKAL